ncbi:MAG: methylase involved in ubiquinone/menaquinone biosynthesis [Firmicutes bacterium]|nr:methylase involved in ubiquinone/menaquinone biosynthesis [Bacillota bacterium]
MRQADFCSESFDAVILSFCIVHLETEEAKAVLRNSIKWLRRDGYIYLSFMEGKTPGFERTSFSEELIYFNYFRESEIEEFLEIHGLNCVRKVRQNYKEQDGSNTVDIFFFLKKL